MVRQQAISASNGSPYEGMKTTLTIRRENFPIRGGFRISRGFKNEARVVVAELERGASVGRGECVPYARYGETVDGVVRQLESVADAVAGGFGRIEAQALLPPGAARNALDCAFWDLEAKATGVPAWKRAGLAEPPQPVATLYTIGLDEPEAMAVAARVAQDRPLLKIKLGRDGVLDRVRAVRAAAPKARLVIDFNEGADIDELRAAGAELVALGVELIEQPLRAGADEALAGLGIPIALGADESVHGTEDLTRLKGLYQVVNVKLDKTGGLTAALAMMARAEREGFAIMVGCMVATSLAMAPALLLAQRAQYVDLDGPLLLTRDREPGLRYDGAMIQPADPRLWG
jgi:L-alanine-DL-glutamate epimerase-like enolase superfamily enzyme